MDDCFGVWLMRPTEEFPVGREAMELQVRILEAVAYMRERGFEEVDPDYLDALVYGRVH